MNILLVATMVPRPRAPSATPPMLHAVVQALRTRHHIALATLVGDDPGERDAIEALRAAGVEVIPAHRSSALPPPWFGALASVRHG